MLKRKPEGGDYMILLPTLCQPINKFLKTKSCKSQSKWHTVVYMILLRTTTAPPTYMFEVKSISQI